MIVNKLFWQYTCCSMSPSSSSSISTMEAGGLRMDTSSSWSSCWHKLSCRCWFNWQLIHNMGDMSDMSWCKWWHLAFILTVLPTCCLQEVPKKFLVSREGWRRAGTNNSMRLNKTLFKTLQTPQAISSQHAEQVSIRSIHRRAAHARTFTHLGEKRLKIKKTTSCQEESAYILITSIY